LLCYLDASSPDHAAYRDAIDASRARFVPGLVLAEVDYFLANDRPAMRALVKDVERRAFIYAPPTDGQLARAMRIDQAYAELGLGLVDATIVALAEELGVVRIATRDVRDFSVVRLADGRPFELAVAPKGMAPRPRRLSRKRR
jgi:predicted nucleic acid-binding protein